ncbi:MAG: hypothetical protein KatS3mg110_3604 [Pirellulaceae bacterium]|nr:MAG: hypothetical protein KatS3mg110_3604 [Pirellulaceae bacterium]
MIKAGPEVVVPVPSPHTLGNLIDALEVHYPSLRHTLRDQEGNRRPYIRFYACRIDISFWSWESGLPESVVQGQEPLLVVGAVSGG